MNAADTIAWLREQADRAPTDAMRSGMIKAAATLLRLRSNLKTAVSQRNEYQAKYLAVKERNAQLEEELKAEMYRHDRLQDFEVAEAEELARLYQKLGDDAKKWRFEPRMLPGDQKEVKTNE